MFKPLSYIENHPNPMAYRNDYTILNGEWDFILDYMDKGTVFNYKKNFPKKSLKINVPYCYMEKRSGIGKTKRCDYLWYHKTITIDNLDKDVILHFEGIDYYTKLYVNGELVGKGKGAYIRHSFNITSYLHIGSNEIIVRVKDDRSVFKPRGKQRFIHKNFLCFYEETTGIYKTVWLEYVPKEHIEYFKMIPSFKNKNFSVYLKCNEIIDNLSLKVSYKGEIVAYLTDLKSDTNEIEFVVDLSNNFHPWDSLKPELYDIEFKYNDDIVLSYIGIRDIYIKESKIYLNDHELYQKLILDQGYIEDGGLTLSDKELEDDILNMIDMGFNGARKHQKRESDVFYSIADFTGYLVWSEMPSFYLMSKLSNQRMKIEWLEILKQLVNHPSIITYTLFNESWGIFDVNKNKYTQEFVEEMYNRTKDFDNSRLVLTNDGWSHLNSDFLTIHLYDQDDRRLKENINNAIYDNSFNKKILSIENERGKPILVDEFGGTSFNRTDIKTWGYGNNVDTKEEYIIRLTKLFNAIKEDNRLSGYCYTQLSDVRQEVNGIYTMDRKPKISKEEFYKINN